MPQRPVHRPNKAQVAPGIRNVKERGLETLEPAPDHNTASATGSPLPMLPIALDVPTACKVAGFGRTSLYEAIKRGAIQTRKAGRRRLVLTESLSAYVHALPSS
jgi:hypothetical protein